jgi:hypothetical protein
VIDLDQEGMLLNQFGILFIGYPLSDGADQVGMAGRPAFQVAFGFAGLDLIDDIIDQPVVPEVIIKFMVRYV